jgi:hypothetical protein
MIGFFVFLATKAQRTPRNHQEFFCDEFYLPATSIIEFKKPERLLFRSRDFISKRVTPSGAVIPKRLDN